MDKKHIIPLVIVAILSVLIGTSILIKRQSKDNHWQWENTWGPIPAPITPGNDSEPEGEEEEQGPEDEPISRTPDNYADALKMAAELEKHILVIFSAEWCGWCKRMDQESWPDESVQKAMKSYIVLKLDVDKSREEARMFKVNYVPDIFIVDSKEKILKRGQYMAATELAEWLAN